MNVSNASLYFEIGRDFGRLPFTRAEPEFRTGKFRPEARLPFVQISSM